jgi:biotin carboxyl carrier protein
MRRYSVDIDDRRYVIDVQETARDRFGVHVEGRDLDVRLASAEDVAEEAITPGMGEAQAGHVLAPYRPPAPETLPPMAPTHPPPLPPLPARNGPGMVTTPMPGTVARVLVAEGDRVARGDVLVQLEAMKMMNAIRAPHDGDVLDVLVQAGQQVGYGAPLVQLAER